MSIVELCGHRLLGVAVYTYRWPNGSHENRFVCDWKQAPGDPQARPNRYGSL